MVFHSCSLIHSPSHMTQFLNVIHHFYYCTREVVINILCCIFYSFFVMKEKLSCVISVSIMLCHFFEITIQNIHSYYTEFPPTVTTDKCEDKLLCDILRYHKQYQRRNVRYYSCNGQCDILNPSAAFDSGVLCSHESKLSRAISDHYPTHHVC